MEVADAVGQGWHSFLLKKFETPDESPQSVQSRSSVESSPAFSIHWTVPSGSDLRLPAQHGRMEGGRGFRKEWRLGELSTHGRTLGESPPSPQPLLFLFAGFVPPTCSSHTTGKLRARSLVHRRSRGPRGSADPPWEMPTSKTETVTVTGRTLSLSQARGVMSLTPDFGPKWLSSSVSQTRTGGTERWVTCRMSQ